MSKHTPGPWYVALCHTGEKCWCRLIVTTPEPNLPNNDYTTETCIAASGAIHVDDAYLIASAPDLLSIAQRWAALDGGAWNTQRHESERAELLADTRAVIATATGAKP